MWLSNVMIFGSCRFQLLEGSNLSGCKSFLFFWPANWQRFKWSERWRTLWRNPRCERPSVRWVAVLRGWRWLRAGLHGAKAFGRKAAADADTGRKFRGKKELLVDSTCSRFRGMFLLLLLLLLFCFFFCFFPLTGHLQRDQGSGAAELLEEDGFCQ